jgi:type II secretory pathway pseudopilin PulG
MKLLKNLRSQSGFSMVEISVAMGLLGLATLAVMNLTDNVTSSSKRAETLLSKSQFASALGTYMYSAQACNEMKGASWPSFDNNPKPIEINDWKVLGIKEDPNNVRGIYTGKEFKNFKIKKFEGKMDTTSANIASVVINGVTYKKTFLNVNTEIEVSQNAKVEEGNNSGKRTYNYFFNVPVLATAAGKVAFCAEEKGIQETCAAMKGVYNPTTKLCDLEKTCKIQGTYRVLSCDVAGYCSGAEGQSQGNPMANGGYGCPSGMGMQTGYKVWTSQAPCSGKKCTPITVTNTMSWFSCLDCPGMAGGGGTSGGSSGGGSYGGGGGGGYSGGGGGCFVAGTQIHLFGGEKKNIEDVKVQDELVDHSGRPVKVLQLQNYNYNGRIYSVNGSGYFFTANHPFLTTQGWKSLDPVLSSKESGIKVTLLKVGDTLVKKDGFEVIKSLDYKMSKEKVYNFTVSDSHEYIAEDFAVHNKLEYEQSLEQYQ